MTETTTPALIRTYRGPGGAGLPRLAALPGVHHNEVEPQQVLEFERYDTDDHRLAAAGIALAVRRTDGAAHWELDLPDGDAREHLRVPLRADAGVPPQVPAELDELLRGTTRERAVRPAGRVRTVRTITRLTGDGTPVELVHDHVTLATLGRSTEVESFSEVEIRGADDAMGAELTRRLADAGLRPAAHAAETELDRLLRSAPARRRRVAPKGSAGAALVDYLAGHVDRLAAQELRVRRDEPDSVHQLRVASRRLRSALAAYRPLLDPDRTAPIVDELRALGRALAPARDAEVLQARISAGLQALEPELLLGPAQAEVTRYFGRIGAQARAAVLAELDGDRYIRLRTALDDLVVHPPLTRRALRPAATELPRLVARTAGRLEKAVVTATDPVAPGRDVAVHAARRAGKRLRYATEVARPVVGREAKAFASALKDLQAALGEHQDTVVARDALRHLGAMAHAAGENGFSFGVLLGRDAAHAERIERDLPALWASAWTKKHRRWLR